MRMSLRRIVFIIEYIAHQLQVRPAIHKQSDQPLGKCILFMIIKGERPLLNRGEVISHEKSVFFL